MGLGWLVNGLAAIDTPETIGPMLAVSILTPFYGSLVNMGIQMFVRFTAVDFAVR
jgi:flagellar motor component MotA